MIESPIHSLTVNGLEWHWTEFGKGERAVLAFGGFGRDVVALEPLWSERLGEQYRVYAFSLFFQGSIFPGERLLAGPLETEELTGFIRKFTTEKGIVDYSLIGYSIGARICLSLLQGLRVEKFIALTPDGLVKNPWYALLTLNPGFSSRALNYFKKGRGVRLIGFLRRLGLISRREYNLAQKFITSPELLEHTFAVWMTYRNIWPDLRIVANRMEQNHTEALFVFGKDDFLISKRAVRAVETKFPGSRVEVLDAGHDMMPAKVSALSERFLLSG